MNHTLFKKEMLLTLELSSLQKIIAAIKILAYGVTIDFMDECLRIGESIAIKSLKLFVKADVSIYSEEYLRSPNDNDIARLLVISQYCGFPRKLRSIS